jgi:NAD(P)-dependent dehydrogenase (short-subunit alcohol dehydrogenase family)
MQIPADWQPPNGLLNNRVILITGAGSGIGAALARHCGALGATVILLDKTVRALEEVYDAIEASGAPSAAIYPMNLEGATEKDYFDLAATIDKEFGRLDGLVHNAGMLGGLIPVAHYEAELWFRVLQVNLNAPFLMTRALLGLLTQGEDTSVVFSSDSVGRTGKAYWGAYGVSKAATENLMQILADELESNTPVRVNSFDPGPVATSLRTLAYPGEDPANLPTPDAVVTPYLYLLGSDSRGVSGKQFSR